MHWDAIILTLVCTALGGVAGYFIGQDQGRYKEGRAILKYLRRDASVTEKTVNAIANGEHEER